MTEKLISVSPPSKGTIATALLRSWRRLGSWCAKPFTRGVALTEPDGLLKH
jgi:hypothetical protein